jgi:hypothetical protein
MSLTYKVIAGESTYEYLRYISLFLILLPVGAWRDFEILENIDEWMLP